MKLENRTLYFGDNLDILREKFLDESIIERKELEKGKQKSLFD